MKAGNQTASPILKFRDCYVAQIRILARKTQVASISAALDLPGFENLAGLCICCTVVKFPL
jgi:hypothetical protein